MHTIVLASGGGSLIDVQPGLIFWTLVTFIVVAFVLRRVAWGPLLQAVNDREKQIQSSIDAAKKERAEAEKLLAEQKTAIAAARSEAAEALRKTQTDMEKLREDLMAKSRKESEELKVDARKTIEAEKVKAIADLKNEAGGHEHGGAEVTGRRRLPGDAVERGGGEAADADADADDGEAGSDAGGEKRESDAGHVRCVHLFSVTHFSGESVELPIGCYLRRAGF